MSSSAICHNFVQNAWKKELCSNCFKSKDEHASATLKLKAFNIVEDTISIIRDPLKNKKKLSVEFTKELIEVIGYGGEDWIEEEEEPITNDEDDDDILDNDDDDDEGEHIKQIRELTKKNTNFNTVSLREIVEEKKSYAHLLLGKPVVNADGKKQTLLVTVTPFGETPITKLKKEATKSLLDEISETLEMNHNSIILGQQKPQKKEENVEKKISLSRAPLVKSREPTRIQKEEPTNDNNNNNNKKITTQFIQKEIENFFSPDCRENPEGREDPKSSELPALPRSPPPSLIVENQNSFLHPIYEKPKIPCKPVLLLKKPMLTTFAKQDDPKKKKAPKPPQSEEINQSSLFTRHANLNVKPDCPVVREMEKRERASSLAPKLEEVVAPAPIPRKSLSMSSDNLLVNSDEKRKHKGRFSLRKFLRMGSNKDLPRLTDIQINDEGVEPPKPRPRLVIVHPSELNGSKVEVVTKPDHVDGIERSKPPPPPRNYDNWKPPMSSAPPPPKSLEILNKQKALSRSNSSANAKTETVYANIGEVRSSIVPNKPVRTASMREREEKQKKHHYEPVGNNNSKSRENVYDYVSNGNRSSSPSTSDSSGKNSPKSKNLRLNKRSESSIDVSGEYFKYGNIPRSMSLTYCGSETESEIYSPYSFYGSETEVTEDDHDWIQNGRTHKLRSKKGRSIVHKNLEDNYGAVIVANHEALAQVLENIQQTIHIQPALRGLKLCANLRLADFSLKSTPAVSVGSKTFHQALWGAQHVTLMFSSTVNSSSALNLSTFNLNPVTEFSDLVSTDYLGIEHGTMRKQSTIAVLPWLQIHTIQSYSDDDSLKSNPDDGWREGFFIMLQLVNALKMLQAQGIEELPLSLTSFVLAKDMEKNASYRLCIPQGNVSSEFNLYAPEEKFGSLCGCASKALALLQPTSKATNLIQSLLNNERSVSLTQAKAVLEFSLWGPTDVALGNNVKERELTLQRWLDLQRATVLHGLVCTRVQLTVYEECHLLFLVRSNARMMSDASMLIESNNLKYTLTSKA